MIFNFQEKTGYIAVMAVPDRPVAGCGPHEQQETKRAGKLDTGELLQGLPISDAK
ncbi:MAG: hypothetical protein LBJ01_05770 [Tannerella sp.]|jgi:hypothetical protein|nr:hypothetical protein [Tannerella sp.]